MSSPLLSPLGKILMPLQFLFFGLCIVHFFPQSNTYATEKMKMYLACFIALCHFPRSWKERVHTPPKWEEMWSSPPSPTSLLYYLGLLWICPQQCFSFTWKCKRLRVLSQICLQMPRQNIEPYGCRHTQNKAEFEEDLRTILRTKFLNVAMYRFAER